MLNGWKHCQLGDILTLQRGFDITKKEQQDGNVPVISSSGINSFHDTAKVNGPGVIIGRKGSLGTVFYVEENYWPHDTTLWVKDFHGSFPKFAYYFLTTLNLAQFDVGASNPTLNRNHVHLLPVYWPPLPTQRKIAAILSAYDDLIENNTRRIAILEEMARTLYREWFVHFRFPGHEKIAMVESALGMIPEGWEVVKLGDVVDINASSIRRGYEPALINYIDITSVSPGKVDKVEAMEFANAPGRARRIVKHGDIIWSTVRPNRRSYSVILDPPENLIVSTGFAVISGKHMPYTYLYHALTTTDFVGYLTNRATGAAYPAVNSEDFQEALIICPSSRLLDMFHAIVAPMFDQKQNLLTKNANLRQTRDLLLPKLMAGEIDVEGMEVGAEATAENSIKE